MADLVQIRAREKRLAHALRANLKRRKANARPLLPQEPSQSGSDGVQDETSKGGTT